MKVDPRYRQGNILEMRKGLITDAEGEFTESLRHIISININELRFMKRPKNPPRSLWGGHYEIPTAMARKR